MKNKRVLAALLAASCLATSFTACSGDTSSSSKMCIRDSLLHGACGGFFQLIVAKLGFRKAAYAYAIVG